VTALLLVLALASAPDAGAPRTFSWDVPEVVAVVPVGNGLEVGGLPLKIFAVRSKWGLDELIIHYAKRFADAGFYLPMGRMRPLPGLKLPRVVALDVESKVSYLVYGWPEADGTTTLILGAADLGARQAKAQGAFPVFPGATKVTTFRLEIAEATSFTVKATEAEVIDFYRSVLPPGGWKEREPGVFVRGGRVLRVLARPEKSGRLGVVVLEQADEPLPGPLPSAE
jgi:hypothetical protein